MAGAFVLDAPGTYVADLEGRLVIGNRPGRLHYAIALGVPAGCLVLLLVLRDVWWLGAGALVLFGLPAILVAFNSQRYEITPGHVAMRGRAAGIPVRRDWTLSGDAAVRVETRVERDPDSPTLWTAYQAQILTSGGSIPIAESTRRERAVSCAELVARTAGVVLQSP